MAPRRPAAHTTTQSLIAGERVENKPGEVLNICSRSMVIEARLGNTGVGPFDDSYFLSFPALDALIAARQKISVAAGVPISAKPVAPAQSVDPLAVLATHHHAVPSGPINCLPDLAPGEVSAFLLQLSPGASAGSVKFAVGQIPGLKIVAGNPVFTASRQALGSLFWGIAVFAGLLLLALLFLVTLLFSAIVQERYREIGLLRAMGARPGQIMSIILIEAGLITSLGGLLGLGFRSLARACFRSFARLLLRLARRAFYLATRLGHLARGRGRDGVRRMPRDRRRIRSRLARAPAGALPDDPDRERAMILRTSGLIKRYGAGAGYEAVSEAELTLKQGEFVSIVGRSGSGKSTLLAMIGALTKPSEGQVLLEGEDIWSLPETALADLRCRHLGFIFQFFSLLVSLRAVDNVALPALLGRSMTAQDAYLRAQNLLMRVGLEDRMLAYPGEMSGGEQRRVVIARALINKPRLLLADEPTSDLDEDTENDIIVLLEELRREAVFGMIVVTHNLELAKRADRMFEMKEGVLTAADLPEGAFYPARLERRFGPAKLAPPANIIVRSMDGARAVDRTR